MSPTYCTRLPAGCDAATPSGFRLTTDESMLPQPLQDKVPKYVTSAALPTLKGNATQPMLGFTRAGRGFGHSFELRKPSEP